jgi:hypothetical protein
MASPPPLVQPVPARSPEKTNVDLRHPIPDLQSLQGAYVGNIERLEDHAERMSESGSDLGEEIRRLHTELKRSDSRRQSFDQPSRQFSTRSRGVSTSSHAASIVDVNGNARWGGYSPGGYVTSPGGSLRSGSISNPSAPVQRQRSESKASRLGQVMHPDEREERFAFGAHPGSPQSLRSAPLAVHRSDSPPSQETRKVSSFTRKYDEIANELRDELRNSVIMDQPTRYPEEHNQYATNHDYPDRPHTAASTDTTRQARSLWQDFDGVHCPNPIPEEEPTPTHSRHSSHHSMMSSSYQLPPRGAPPPDDSMVFYPAPVPRMLNLPKRLSQLPAPGLHDKRRSQLLDSMQVGNRKSAPLLGEMLGEPSQPAKRNRQSMAALPPQLRASAYFDQPASSQEFAVQGDSAIDTLDSILDASARAPVSAFTDHPFSGHAGKEVYGPEHKRKTSKLANPPPPLAETRRRSSFMMLDTKRNSSGDMLNKLRKRNSSADMNLLVLKASESRMSLGGELDEHAEDIGALEGQDHEESARRSYDDQEGRNPDDVYDEEHEGEELEPEEEEEEEQIFGAPTTLLAELQLRKAKQKTRNMNYATLVEQGNMPTHRTLLQLNDIAEEEKQKRIKKKVNLAWEAQADDDSSDDDVPLAVLYKQPNPQANRDWDRPVGLIAQRDFEEKEPLSRRRVRLRGDDPRRTLGQSPSQMHLAVPTSTTPGPETDEEEGETLGERMRRLREKKELDEALGADIRKSTISLDFASEMMSKIGLPDTPAAAPLPAPSPGPDEEETLGQRRARLQAEAAARERPALHNRLSMADVLAANPIDVHNQARKISDQQLISNLPAGSLLQQNVVAESRRKAERMQQNARASSYGSFDPLIRAAPERNDENDPLAQNIRAYKTRMSGMPALNQPQQQQPQMMMGGMSGMGQQMMGQQMMPMNMMGMQPGMMMGMNGVPVTMQQMQMQMNMMQMNGMGLVMPPMDPRQRDQIDRWMAGVQQ